jgi:hypothetical protein
MKSFLKLSVFGLLVFFMSSCGHKNEAGKMIPVNAGLVMRINLQSLGNKLSWQDIQQSGLYKKFISDSSIENWKKSLLQNPSASGIDFQDGLIFFTASHTHNGKKYFAAEGKLKNENDFIQFNKNFSNGAEPSKDGELTLLNLKENNVVGWNKNDFIYVMNPGNTAYHLNKWKENEDSGDNTPPADRSA